MVPFHTATGTCAGRSWLAADRWPVPCECAGLLATWSFFSLLNSAWAWLVSHSTADSPVGV